MSRSSLKAGEVLDLFFPSSSRHPYYVVTPDYTRYSAGIKVLHTLCHMLNMRGQSAFVVTGYVNPDLVTPKLTEDIVDAHFAAKRTPIVVYPERLVGNPLEASCVVRYLLNIPGLLGGEGAFRPEEILIWYAEQFREACNGTGPILEIPTSDARIFSPPVKQQKRSGSCFYAGKFKRFANGDLLPMTRDSVEIPYGGDGKTGQQDLAELFRRSEVFYAYEDTALTVEATLCGCPAVIIPTKYTCNLSDEVLSRWPGIAWGTEPAAVEQAKRTVGAAYESYTRRAEAALKQVDEFVQMTQQIAATRAYTDRIRLVDPHAPPASLPPPVPLRERGKNAVKALLGRLQ
jgi:hypothetical protein